MARVDKTTYPFIPQVAPRDLGEGHRAWLIEPRFSFYVTTATARWLAKGHLPRRGNERMVVDASGCYYWLGRTGLYMGPYKPIMTVWHIKIVNEKLASIARAL